MIDKLLPGDYGFVRWMIKLRWGAVILLIVSAFFVSEILEISIRRNSILVVAVILIFLNLLFFLHEWYIRKKDLKRFVFTIRQNLHIQIATDFILLTVLLHFSGGVENPFIIYYVFHMIIASTILTPKESYLQTSLALMLVGALAFLECFSIIPHYTLGGFITHSFYQNKFFLTGTGFVFVTTSYIVVSVSNSIVSRSRKSEGAYLKANAQLEQKDKLKNEYVMRLTHDIKGHLAAIIGCLRVVQTNVFGEMNENQKEFVNRAFDRTDLLANYVSDLLNLTRKRLKNDNERESFSLKEAIEKVVNGVRISAKDKSIIFDVSIDQNVGNITGNPFSIEELYANILLNAVKYTPENGNIRLTVKNRPEFVITEISDSGIGIPEDEIPKVFDEFFRASNVKKDTKSGSGLGLALAKQIVENHNGRIWVESKLGAGTKFTFSLEK